MLVAEEDRKQVPADEKRELAEQYNSNKQMAEDLDRQERFLEKNIGCSMLRRKSLSLITKHVTKQTQDLCTDN